MTPERIAELDDILFQRARALQSGELDGPLRECLNTIVLERLQRPTSQAPGVDPVAVAIEALERFPHPIEKCSACDWACKWCSKHNENGWHKEDCPILTIEKVLVLLKESRR